jgi:dephospho-CoA kinase
MTLGLTGGMGCGKSTAARLLAERGWRVFDADQVVRDEVLREPAVVAAIRARWPEAVDGADSAHSAGSGQAGGVRREAVAARVFVSGGDGELRWLEELTHPRVMARWREAVAAEPGARWVAEVPLLFEKNLEKCFDFTVCVAASLPSQLARLAGRGLSHASAEARISKQLPLAKKTELADFVLSNDGTPDALRAQVARLDAALLARG